MKPFNANKSLFRPPEHQFPLSPKIGNQEQLRGKGVWKPYELKHLSTRPRITPSSRIDPLCTFLVAPPLPIPNPFSFLFPPIFFCLDFTSLRSEYEMGSIFGFRTRRRNSRSLSSVDDGLKINSGSSSSSSRDNSVGELRSAEEASRYPYTAMSLPSEKEKGGTPQASSAAPACSKSNKYSLIPDNFSTVEQVTSSSSSSSSILGSLAFRLVISFRRL